ncbi:transposase [Streptococcus pneumoniae]|nr:transposase [Streptococcus pneumoniae]CVL39896.1 transposase [Streptococcus pneumoniae]CVO29861.1 transposase [Streptococcus pneumoniae]CVO35074.1 transposase [Streptococcus pneumoniae]CVP71658.1 transposase [Streptococcus pneumoniae]
MKSDKTIIRKIHMEQLHFITKLLDIKDPNIKILDIINMDTHKEIIAKLDYEAPSCPDCGSLMKKKEPEKFFGLIEDNLKQVHPIFQTVFKTFLKNKEKIVNALQLPYSNAKLEATNNLIKLIKRNAFGFRNFENFKKRIFIALNIKKERTKFVLSQA